MQIRRGGQRAAAEDALRQAQETDAKPALEESYTATDAEVIPGRLG